jgi:phosphinothricin acetyltransferase
VPGVDFVDNGGGVTAPDRIREIRRADLDALVAIYNHYVLTTHVTFDVEPYTVATRTPWFEQFGGERHRCFVAEAGGRVVGYACSAPFKPKPAYATSVEVSVYLAPDATGRALGRALYAALFAALETADVHRAYALIALPNDPSLALHRAFGFREVAHLHEVGRKFGRYWDVVYYERAVGSER